MKPKGKPKAFGMHDGMRRGATCRVCPWPGPGHGYFIDIGQSLSGKILLCPLSSIHTFIDILLISRLQFIFRLCDEVSMECCEVSMACCSQDCILFSDGVVRFG